MRFLREVDTAVCYVNASTQFTDGAQFGMGAEIIDATQKFAARGPVGLREICTYKWIVLRQRPGASGVVFVCVIAVRTGHHWSRNRGRRDLHRAFSSFGIAAAR